MSCEEKYSGYENSDAQKGKKSLKDGTRRKGEPGIGKKHIMRLILQKTKELLRVGILFTGLGVALFVLWKMNIYDVNFPIMALFTLIGGIILIVQATEVLRDPYAAEELIKNPDLFRQADEILINEIYRDKYMILSERVIANANNHLQMAYRDEVFLVYIFTIKDEVGIRGVSVKLETARSTIMIDVTNEMEYEIDELINRICKFCRYAKAGYSQEGLDYLEDMRIRWKIDKCRKQERAEC